MLANTACVILACACFISHVCLKKLGLRFTVKFLRMHVLKRHRSTITPLFEFQLLAHVFTILLVPQVLVTTTSSSAARRRRKTTPKTAPSRLVRVVDA